MPRPMTVSALIYLLQDAKDKGTIDDVSPVTLVVYDGLDVVEHVMLEHVAIMTCIAGTKYDGAELSGNVIA
jgi:hypothetical protein